MCSRRRYYSVWASHFFLCIIRIHHDNQDQYLQGLSDSLSARKHTLLRIVRYSMQKQYVPVRSTLSPTGIQVDYGVRDLLDTMTNQASLHESTLSVRVGPNGGLSATSFCTGPPRGVCTARRPVPYTDPRLATRAQSHIR